MSRTTGLSVADYVKDTELPNAAEHAYGSAGLDRRVELYGLVQRIFLNSTLPVSKVVFSGFADRRCTGDLCAAVAGILAKTAGPVCIVEAAERGGELSHHFGLTRDRSEHSCFESDEPISSFLSCVDGDRLFLLPGSAWQAENALLTYKAAVSARFDELGQQFRFVVVYVPFAASVGALMLAKLTDGILLVLEASRTRRDRAKSVVDGLRAAGVAVLGAVLNTSTKAAVENLPSSL